MRLIALLTLITACSSHGSINASGTVDTTGEAGEPSTVTHGGHPVVSRAGSASTGGSSVTESGVGGAGGNVVIEDGGASGEATVTIGGEGGSPLVTGSAGEAPGGAAGESGQGGAAGSASVVPWKVCGSAVCADDEVCVYDTETSRVCTKINDQFGHCDPYGNAPADVAAYCAAQLPACAVAYRRCNWMSSDAAGTMCPMFGKVDGERWNCGPPL